MKFTEKVLEVFAKSLSDTEKAECKHAIDMVKDALEENGYTLTKSLSTHNDEMSMYYVLRDSTFGTLTVLLQGSYANNTNIRRVSDVDISVLYNPILPISFEIYKQNIYEALKNKFGTNSVERKNKSIRVEGNTYRKSIDVVPAFLINQTPQNGIYIITDKERERINNYPIQHIENGYEKNKATGYRYKKYVRVIKYLKFWMEESKIASASQLGSFNVESLIWNVPDEVFRKYNSLGAGVQEVINYLKIHEIDIYSYKEANGIKELCTTYEEYKKYKTFVTDLQKFYEYDYTRG